MKSASPSNLTLSAYGTNPPLIQPSLLILLYNGISCALRLTTSLRYFTRSFALSLVTNTPLSANCDILDLLNITPQSTVISRHLLSLKNASLTFSVSVSILIYLSVGIIGCGQAVVVTGIPWFVTSVMYTPKSFATHFPQLNCKGASVKAVLLLPLCFCNCVLFIVHAFSRLLNSLNLPTSWHFRLTASMNCAFSSTSVVSSISKNNSSLKLSVLFISLISFSFILISP